MRLCLNKICLINSNTEDLRTTSRVKIKHIFITYKLKYIQLK